MKSSLTLIIPKPFLLPCIMIIFTYRPKTPSRKDSGGSGGSPSRKISNTSVESYDSPDLMTRSLSRCSNSSRKNEGSVNGRKKISYSGTKSLGRSSGISFLNDLEHTVVKLIFFSLAFLWKIFFYDFLGHSYFVKYVLCFQKSFLES